jgi:hypothetical protein
MPPGRRPGRCQSWAEAGSSPGFGVKGQYGAPPEANFLTTFQLRLLTTFRIDASKAKPRSSRGVSGDDPAGGAGVASTAARNRGYETPGAAARQETPGGVEPSHRIRRQCRRRKRTLGRQRHGGAPRGGVPVARDGPCLASVASRAYERDQFKAMRLPALRLPLGRGRVRRVRDGFQGKTNPGAKRAAGRKKLRCLTS